MPETIREHMERFRQYEDQFLTPLERAQRDAVDRMCHVASIEEFEAALELANSEKIGPEVIADFREKFSEYLAPETIHYLELSEIKKREWIEHHSDPVDTIH